MGVSLLKTYNTYQDTCSAAQAEKRTKAEDAEGAGEEKVEEEDEEEEDIEAIIAEEFPVRYSADYTVPAQLFVSK